MLKLGSITRWGKIIAVGFVGERYYWMKDIKGVISMIPATLVEDEYGVKGFRAPELVNSSTGGVGVKGGMVEVERFTYIGEEMPDAKGSVVG